VQRRWLTSTLDDRDLVPAPPVLRSAVAPAILLFTQAIEAEALSSALVPVVGVIWAAELTLAPALAPGGGSQRRDDREAMAMALRRLGLQSGMGGAAPERDGR
jgi:hypothetical protein